MVTLYIITHCKTQSYIVMDITNFHENLRFIKFLSKTYNVLLIVHLSYDLWESNKLKKTLCKDKQN